MKSKSTLILLLGLLAISFLMRSNVVFGSTLNIPAERSNLPDSEIRIFADNPTITSINPNEAFNWSSTNVTISGSNFVATPDIRLNNSKLEDALVINPTTISATVPAHLPGGTYTLTITNPDDQTFSLDNAFTVLISGDGSLDNWQTTSSLTTPRIIFGSAESSGYIYAVGGENGTGDLSSVERAKIKDDGSLDTWQIISSMNNPRRYLKTVRVKNFLYSIGGINVNEYLDTVEYAEILSDGTLGTWQYTSTMNTERGQLAAVAVNNYIYAIGGVNNLGNTLDTVERAEVNTDGSLGAWQEVSSLTIPRCCMGAVEAGGYLYIIGGYNCQSPSVEYDSIERAIINRDGTLGSWEVISNMTTPRINGAYLSTTGYIFALGGSIPGAYLGSVEQTTIHNDGSLDDWHVIDTLLSNKYGFEAVEVNSQLYILGGHDESGFLIDTVEWTNIGPVSISDINPSAFPADSESYGSIHGNNFLPTPIVTLGTSTNLNTQFIDTNTATVTIPSGLEDGFYNLTLANPNGQTNTITNAVRIDSFKPVATSLEINGGALNTTSLNVTLSLFASDSSDPPNNLFISFSNDNTNWSDWEPFNTKTTWTIQNGDGLKTVYGRVSDKSGNISNVVSDNIDLDSLAGGEFGLTINNGALFTNQLLVIVKIGSSPGTAQMQVSNDGGFAGTIWEPYSSNKDWKITQYGEYVIPRVVYVRYKDTDGNLSSTYQDDIILDVNAPVGSVEVISNLLRKNSISKINENNPSPPFTTKADTKHTFSIHLPLIANKSCNLPAGNDNVTLLLSAHDDVSGVGYMMIGNDLEFTCDIWEEFVTQKTWYAPKNTETIYVKFRDNAGNVSEVVSDFIK